MNKGLQIWYKKKQRKRKKNNALKKRQKGNCRFICYLNPEYERRNGKTYFVGRKEIRGLQIDSTLFYIDNGKISHKFTNKSGGKLLEIYTLEEALNSSFVNEELIKKYEEHINKQGDK